MQKDVDTVATARPIALFGVNETGEESDNALVCAGRTIPWLQDIPAVNAWDAWQVTYRDVIVLDHETKVVRAYNLTSHDLAIPANYAELRAILLDAAD
jgi:hypothetical protein